MTNEHLHDFDALLEAQIRARNAPAVLVLLLLDPRSRFSLGFNRHMAHADAIDTEIAFFRPLGILTRRIHGGRIADAENLFKLLWGIQKRVGWNLATRAHRRANPRLQVRRRRGEPRPTSSRPLIVPATDELNDVPGLIVDPANGMLRRELFRYLLNGSRAMGKMPQRVLREVHREAQRFRGTYGAYKAVAGRAKVDASGKVIAIRPQVPGEDNSGEPPEKTVKQIRGLYRKAMTYLRGRR